MGTDPTTRNLIAQLIKDLGMSDPHIKGVVLSSSSDAIPIRYYTAEQSEDIVKDLTSRLVIAYSTFRTAANKIAGGQSIDNVTVNMENEFIILKPVKNRYLLVLRGEKPANLGLIYLKLSKTVEELEKVLK